MNFVNYLRNITISNSSMDIKTKKKIDEVILRFGSVHLRR